MAAGSWAPSTRASRRRPPPPSTATSTPPGAVAKGGPGQRVADVLTDDGRLERRPGRRRDASRSSRPARSRRMPAPSSGRCRGPCGSGWSTDEIDPEDTLTQALNCLLVETPAGRALVETGIGERMDDQHREQRGVPAGHPAGPPRRRLRPRHVDVVALSHLHFDHAGGLLAADGDARLPPGPRRRAGRRVGVRTGHQPRLQASYDQDELRLVEPWARGGLGRRRRGGHARGLGHPDRRPLGRPPGHRRSRPGLGTWASSATCACGRGAPIHAGSRLRRLPADERRGQGVAVPPGVGRGLDGGPVA